MIRQRGILWVVLAVALAGTASNFFQVQSQEPLKTGTDTVAPATARTLLDDWPAPEIAFIITGGQNGYIEPCGCAGLENQKGGLARRDTLLRQLNDRAWNLIPVDVGNQIRRFGRQPEIKFQTTIEALRKMKYQAIGLGPDDLRLSIGELLVAVGIDGEPNPLISANASILGYNGTHQVVRVGRFTIGITSVLGTTEQKAIHSDEIEFSKPADGLRTTLAALRKEKCNVFVLLANASTAETKAIARAFPDFRIVITTGGAGGAAEPALKPERIEGTNSYLIQTGKKGMYVGVLGVFDDPRTPIRYQRIPLDASFGDSKEMLGALTSYQQQLEALGLEQLGLKPVKHPSGYQFVGSEACRDCHESAYDVWSSTPHHEATHSIAHPTARSDIQRHHDPECLSCHVTGWHPQSYFPYESGYLDLETSKLLHGNGCENCHGPGSAHVAAENGEGDYSDQQLRALQLEMRLPLSEARDLCLQCHDLDNDPDFQKEGAFEKYWDQIKHYE